MELQGTVVGNVGPTPDGDQGGRALSDSSYFELDGEGHLELYREGEDSNGEVIFFGWRKTVSKYWM